jgi:hypothetical protein
MGFEQFYELSVFIAGALGKCGRSLKTGRIGVDNQGPFPYKNQQKLETPSIIQVKIQSLQAHWIFVESSGLFLFTHSSRKKKHQ